jgi:small subunit ribosomal protein S9
MPTKSTAKKTTTRKPAVRRRVTKAAAPATTAVAEVQPVVRARKTINRTYIFSIGRRKEAVARVRWYAEGSGEITVNGRELKDYFPVAEQQQLVRSPMTLSQMGEQGKVSAKVAGGGTQGQAESVRLGIARALVKQDADLRIPLKRAGYLRRDPRVKERKKYGLKRARRAPQWQKR